MSKPVVSPYGSWKSPISIDKVGGSSKFRLQDVCTDQHSQHEGEIAYFSIRSPEDGRNIIYSLNMRSIDYFNETICPMTSWTPAGFNARTRNHEYGGAAFFVHNKVVYFSNMADQKLYKQENPTTKPEPLTQTENHFFADGHFSTALNAIYIVREDHSQVVTKVGDGSAEGARKEAETTIVRIDPATGDQQVVVKGADFYSSPRVSPDGKRLLWIEWDHPNMPWDNTSLKVAELDPHTGLIASGRKPVTFAGRDVLPENDRPEEVSVCLPCWTKSGSILYMGDQSGFHHLWLVGSPSDHKNLTPTVTNDLAFPPWVFRMNSYVYLAERDEAVIALPHEGFILINNVSGSDPKSRVLSTTEQGYTEHNYLLLSKSGVIHGVGFSSIKPCLFIATNPNSGLITPMESSDPIIESMNPDLWSPARHVVYPTDNEEEAHAWLYLPRNPDFVAPEGSLPPLLVRAHGGPTGWAFTSLQLSVQFWTSRGFAVLDVDYRGSGGYGRKYRDSLRKNWGLHDVADCCAGVEYLVKEKLVDADKVCIDGGSAGGFTTLNTLTFRDVFKAGACLYGVADVELLAKETHKFESRYLDNMIGPYPECMEIYKARSSIHHLDKFNCPCIFFQGDEDKIVPPNQSVLMHESVKKKGLPCALVMYPGEQHGFRKKENIEHCLFNEFYFFSRIFGFTIVDDGKKVKIDNLD